MSQETALPAQEAKLGLRLYQRWNTPCSVSHYSSLTGHGKQLLLWPSGTKMHF
jgi:hypothetical protein